MVHGLSAHRISSALRYAEPTSVASVWELLESIGFDPYVVLGKDDFEEVLRHGGRSVKSGYAKFSPSAILRSPEVSAHVKAIIREFDRESPRP
jgi:hypothetical protein